MQDTSASPTHSWCCEEWYHGAPAARAMSLMQFIARAAVSSAAADSQQSATIEDTFKAFKMEDDPGSAAVPELPGLGAQEEVTSFRILCQEYKDHTAYPLVKQLYHENSSERAQALSQLRSAGNLGQLGIGWFCWNAPAFPVPRAPSPQVLKEIESKTLTAGVVSPDSSRLYFTDSQPVLSVVKDVAHCAPTKVYPADKDFLHRLGLASVGLDYVKDGVLQRLLNGVKDKIRTNGHVAGAMNRDLFTNKTGGLRGYLKTNYVYKVDEKAQSGDERRFGHVGFAAPFFDLAKQIFRQTYCLSDEVAQNGPVALPSSYEEAEAAGLAQAPNYEASPGPLLEKHYKSNAEYFTAEGAAAIRHINDLLSGLRSEVYVDKWIENHKLNGMEAVVQSWAQKADVYKRKNFFTKIRKYCRSDVRLSITLGLFSRALKKGQAHMFSAEAERRQDQVQDALPGIVGNYSMLKGGHLNLVRFLMETQENSRKGFNMILGDTTVFSTHARDESVCGNLGPFKGWMAPDVEAFDRQVPPEVALLLVPVFLLIRGWTAEEVKRGLKFLYKEEQDEEGNIRFVPAGQGREDAPKWWAKNHEATDERRSWNAFVTDQLVLQLVAVNLFSAPQATFLKRIVRPLHGMSSGPQLHSDTCQLVVAMIMAIARKEAGGTENLQFTAEQYVNAAEALGFSFKDPPTQVAQVRAAELQ